MRCLSAFSIVLLGMLGIAAIDDGRALLAAQPRINTNQKPATTNHDYEMTAADTCKVRTMVLPDGVDPAKMSFDEKRKRKGNASEQNLPGYKADFEDIQPGDVVQCIAGTPQVTKASTTTQYVNPSTTHGTVVKCDASNKTITIKVSSTTMVNRNYNANNNNNNNKNNKNVTVVEASEHTLTQIVVMQHAKAPAAAGGTAAKKASE